MIMGHLDRVYLSEQIALTSPRGLYAWSPKLKLALIALVIVLNTWLALPWLSAGLLFGASALVCWTRIPWQRQLPYLLVPLWPVIFVFLGLGFGFGREPLIVLGPIKLYAEGITLAGQITVRAYCDILWLMAYTVTTPFPQIIATLRWFRVPGVLVDTLAMMYRYAFVLYAEFLRMRFAAQARGGAASGFRQMNTYGRIAAQIFMRSFDRSERIYLAMTARGGERYD